MRWHIWLIQPTKRHIQSRGDGGMRLSRKKPVGGRHALVATCECERERERERERGCQRLSLISLVVVSHSRRKTHDNV